MEVGAGQAVEVGAGVQGRPDDHAGRLFPSTGSTTDDAGLLRRVSVHASMLEVLELVESLQGDGASESLFGAVPETGECGCEKNLYRSPSLGQDQHQQGSLCSAPSSSSSSSSSSAPASDALLYPLDMAEEEVKVG